MSKRWYELLMDDHTMHEKVFAAIEKGFSRPEPPPADLIAGAAEYISEYLEKCHNRKEEEHLFPLVEGLGIPREGGPLAVMLMEHERQRDLVRDIRTHAGAYAGGEVAALTVLRGVLEEYIALCKDHFWKENDILYPMAMRVMSPGDEDAVVRGIEAVEASLGEGVRARYYALAERLATAGEVKDLSCDLDRDVLAAVLNTLPVELSFVDADDRVRYFSHEDHDKIFPRSRSVIGMAVQNCHPQKSLHKVNRILEDFRAGRRKVAEFWIDFRGRKVHIRYFPVRDRAGRYLGCLEVVQDITAIQGLKGERRLLDD